MANRKEYEMLFAVNATLNGSFKSTFSSAQTEFAKLGREIQELHKLQSNVSAYQKQEQAISATTQKLANLQHQHELIQTEIKETTGSTAALEREKLKLEQQISSTTTALERQNQRFDTSKAKLKEAGVDTSNLASESQRLAAQMQELSQRQEEAANKAKSFGEQAVQGITAIHGVIIAAGIADKIGEIKDAYMECVSVAANFEESMSTVEALSSSTAREMAELTASAKEFGATTKYTALQAADAMGYMGMAGWNAQEMMAGMDGVIDLAAASGEDLARVSDIVTDNLTAFGLTAADTAHFADVLAAAATSSNTSVSIMGETFKQSASIAGALGYSIEDVAVSVGLMANAGVKGSIAGTALKNMFNGLLEGATLTSEAFGEYEFSAIRADGTMKDFAGTIDELRIYFGQMTEAERVNNAMAIAGQRGYNDLLAILNATDADYQSLTKSINNCSGAAKRMADIKMDNLNGQLTLMNSAWEALQTTIGEQFNPELRQLAELGMDVLCWMNGFVQAHPGLIKGITVFAGGVGSAVTALTAFAAVSRAVAAASAFMAASIPGVNVILGVTAAVSGVAAAVTGLKSALDVGVPSVEEMTKAAAEMRETMEAAETAYNSTATSVLATASVADTYIGKLEEMGDYARLSAAEQREYHNILAILGQTIPELADSIDLENTAIEGGTAVLRSNAEAWKQNALAQAYQKQFADIYQSYSAALVEAKENSILLTMAQGDMAVVEQKVADILERMRVLEAEEPGDKEETKRRKAEYKELEAALADANDEYQTARLSVDAYTKAVAEGEEAVEAARDEIDLKEKAVRKLNNALEELPGVLPELAEALYPVLTQLEQMTAAYNQAYAAALESISGQYSLWDKAVDITAISASSINAALESQVSYWEAYDSNLQSLGERSADIEGLSDMIATFADGSKDSINAIAGMSKVSDDELRDMVANWEKLQEQQSKTSESLAELAAGFPEQMDALVLAVEEGVKDMSMPDEARESARKTIQAFIDEAEAMSGPVQEAYAQLAKYATDSLGLGRRVGSTGHSGDAGNVDVEDTLGFASGVSNAPPGWAWVGEEGPELIHMRGGETVLPTDVSREFALLTEYKNKIGVYDNAPDTELALMSAYPPDGNPQIFIPDISMPPALEVLPVPSSGGASAPINVEVHFHIEGNAAPETVDTLRAYEDELVEKIRTVIKQEREDAAIGYWD